MSHVIRPSKPADLDALYDMAKLTGVGFTNLPPDRDALAARLARSADAFGQMEQAPGDDLYVLMLEEVASGRIVGTAQIFASVGQQSPFYTYRIGTLSQTSQELGRTFRAEMLNLTTDHEGATEVGGLFLHPRKRASGLGLLLARSRYLFIRAHRARFADKVLAELRGVIDEAGNAPFWEGLAGRFFQMSFRDADAFNASHGTQFIADLMPRHPIYTAMLDEHARSVIGVPHPSGRAAMRMLEREGFAYDGYIDIFDGGPTMTVQTDRLRTIAEARDGTIVSTDAAQGVSVLVAAGELLDFRCTWAKAAGETEVEIDADAALRLRVGKGDNVVTVAR